ncbi:hypothetical protein AMTR_s00139p00059000 [Amborella trichopoda]|uniref:Uncharacterized protein n=1 Tax=Amborella trichopoda TaxID=13333 RepID=W1NEM5_AMBTC|nr:hypothetical protein AMTR_s00139p00059000 [Amborella trichopoda]
MKAVNSEARAVSGLAKEVPIQLDAWTASCMVPTKGKGVEVVSTLQLEKGLKKGQATFVAALLEEEGSGEKPIPQKVQEVL